MYFTFCNFLCLGKGLRIYYSLQSHRK